MPYDLIGHEEAIRYLEASLARDRLSHAYLILGPDQVGKRTLALQLAMALNCLEPQTVGGGPPLRKASQPCGGRRHSP